MCKLVAMVCEKTLLSLSHLESFWKVNKGNGVQAIKCFGELKISIDL
jgi:hypothetical protein